METRALGSGKRRRPCTASPEGSSEDQTNETQSKALGIPSLRTILSGSSSDEDDEFLNQISQKTPFRKLPRVSLGSDQKVQKDKTASKKSEVKCSLSTKKATVPERKSQRPYLSDSDSGAESNNDCHDTLDDRCETLPGTFPKITSQHERNDNPNDLTDSSEEPSPAKRRISSKKHLSKSLQTKRSAQVVPTTSSDSKPVNAGRFDSRTFSKVESQRHPTTDTRTDGQNETGDMNSDGDQSVDTVQLTRRLRANLGPKHGDFPAIHSPACARGSPSSSKGPGEDYSLSISTTTLNIPTKSQDALTPSHWSDKNSVEEQSVDTVQLTCRLRANLGTKRIDSPPRPVASKQSTRVARMPGNDGWITTDAHTITLPTTCKERLSESDKERLSRSDEEENSLSGKSVDTAQLTRRLRGNLGMTPSFHVLPTISTPVGASIEPRSHDSKPPDARMFTLPTKAKDISSPSDDDISLGEQSVDTAQLTRRLRSNLGTQIDDSPPIQVMVRDAPEDMHRPRASLANDADARTAKTSTTTKETCTHHDDEQASDIGDIASIRKANFRTKQGSATSLIDHRNMNLSLDSTVPKRTGDHRREGTSEHYTLTTERHGVTSFHPTAIATSLRQNNLCSWKDTPINSEVQGRVSEPAILEFRLPSQSESSSDDDTVSDEDVEEEDEVKNTNRLNPRSRAPISEHTDEFPNHTVATIDDRPSKISASAVPAFSSKSQRQMLTMNQSTSSSRKQTHTSPDDCLMSTNRCHKSNDLGPESSTGQRSVGRNDRQHEEAADCQKNEKRCHAMMAIEDGIFRQSNDEVSSSLAQSHDLYEAAFGDFGSQGRFPPASNVHSSSPRGPCGSHGKDFQLIDTKERRITTSVQNTGQIGDAELFHEAFVVSNGRSNLSNDACKNPCIVLLDSDSDDCESRQNHQASGLHNFHPQPPLVHEGLRTTRQSPRFNIASRVFPKHQGTVTVAVDVPIHDDIADDEDDSVNEDNYQVSHSGARRVTQDHALSIRRNRVPLLAREGNVEKVDNVPATSAFDLAGEASVGVSGLTRPWKRSGRPRIRDAAASNPLNAASAAATRSLRQGQDPVLGGPARLGTSSIAQQRQSLQHQRNDVFGGSGAGVAGFTFSETRRPLPKTPNDEENDSKATSGSDAPPTTRPTKRSKRVSNRKNVKSSGTKRGRKTAKSSTKRGGWSARRRGRGYGKSNRSGVQGTVWDDDATDTWNSSQAYKREDPAMKHVGGAEITF